jgi:hypothetical protein
MDSFIQAASVHSLHTFFRASRRRHWPPQPGALPPPHPCMWGTPPTLVDVGGFHKRAAGHARALDALAPRQVHQVQPALKAGGTQLQGPRHGRWSDQPTARPARCSW